MDCHSCKYCRYAPLKPTARKLFLRISGSLGSDARRQECPCGADGAAAGEVKPLSSPRSPRPLHAQTLLGKEPKAN